MERKKVIQFCAIPVNALKINLTVKKKVNKKFIDNKEINAWFF